MSSQVKLPVHPESTATFVFQGMTVTLREAERVEGGGLAGPAGQNIGVVNSFGSSSSRNLNSTPNSWLSFNCLFL